MRTPKVAAPLLLLLLLLMVLTTSPATALSDSVESKSSYFTNLITCTPCIIITILRNKIQSGITAT
jgi:hypothetical protein